jgi:hypothetical protein
LIKILHKNIIYFSTCFFVIINILDNKGELGLKYISFFILVVSLSFVKHKISKSEYLLLINLLFFYILSLFTTVLNGGNFFMSFTYNFFFMTFFLCLLLTKHIDKEKILKFVMNSLFYCSLMIILGNFFSNIYLVEPIVNFLKLFAMNFDEYDGIRESSMLLRPKIYFHFTLFLPAALTYFLYQKNYLKTILLLIAILLSISRGAILVTIFIFFIYIFSFKSFKDLIQKSILLYITSIILIEAINLFVPGVLSHVLDLNDSSNYTVNTRLSQINIVLDIFSENINYFLFGMGSGTPIYSPFLNIFVYNIEIAPLEILRKYGVLFFILFFGVLIKIIAQNLKSNMRNSIILLSLLLATFSNPILTSPLFILIYFLCDRSNTKLSL